MKSSIACCTALLILGLLALAAPAFSQNKAPLSEKENPELIGKRNINKHQINKFSRGAEEEADVLGAQYMWAAGYDPHSLVTFFEKLQAKEKKKPGTMAKIFSTHPIVGDRIDKVNALVARFPDRPEYTLSTSEFNRVKNRLVAFTNARAGRTGHGEASAEQDSKRPTLKRRQPAPPGDADADQEQKPVERPTLRRRPDSNDQTPSKPPTHLEERR